MLLWSVSQSQSAVLLCMRTAHARAFSISLLLSLTPCECVISGKTAYESRSVLDITAITKIGLTYLKDAGLKLMTDRLTREKILNLIYWITMKSNEKNIKIEQNNKNFLIGKDRKNYRARQQIQKYRAQLNNN